MNKNEALQEVAALSRGITHDAAQLLHLLGTAAWQAPIPGTDKYVVVGTLAMIGAVATDEPIAPASADNPSTAGADEPECAMCNDSGIVGFPPDQYEDCPDCLKARAAQSASKDTPESMANSNARFAIDGAIQYGRENRNQPPSTDHWLYEYWNIGRQLNEAGRTGWDNVTPLAAPVAQSTAGAANIRPSDDDLWDQTLRERDHNADMADKLAEAIAKHFGVEIGEHSNMNCPWHEALEAIESATSAAAQPVAKVGESADAKDAAMLRWLEANPSWGTRWRIKRGNQQWQMWHDGEPWGQWGSYRKVIAAAMQSTTTGATDGAVGGGHE